MNDPLFEPLAINRLTLKNRIVMPPMHLNMARNFAVSDQLVDFYAERARGGAGLITVGYATIDELAGSPGYIGAHRDDLIPGLARLATAIKEHGAAAAVQLNHAGRYNHSMLLGGKQPVAPSAVPSRLTRETPRALDREEIDAVIGRFAEAAGRVKAAGFDAVEILAGTGYLISEFLSPLTNRRDDEYGGALENRMRFGLEVVRAVRAAVGADFPLLVRLNGNEFMPGGSTREDLQTFAVRLVESGVDALCVNVGWHESQMPQIVTAVPRGVFAYLARGIKERVAVPVIASHRINDPQVARQLLTDGVCDLVAMGRALIADPYLPAKTLGGREGEIVHCVACGQGCFDHLLQMKPVECLCNPRAGHERTRQPIRSEAPKKVMVIGGGAAGMSAALAAAESGHQVTLYEQSSRLGGQLHLAGAPPGREEFRVLADDLARQLSLHGVDVQLGQPVDESLIDRLRPDAVILATGGAPIAPPIPGAELPHVVQAWQVLAGQARLGRRVVVIGGNAVGVETALYLAEQGTLSAEELRFLFVHGAESPKELSRLALQSPREVTVLEMADGVGKNFGRTTRWGMLQDLERFGVRTRTGAKALEITPQLVRIEMNGLSANILADSVVLAVGTRSYNPLQDAMVKRGLPCQVVGDAREVALVFDAIHQGFNAGRAIS